MNRHTLQTQTCKLPGADPRSDRFRCGGRESDFLAVTLRGRFLVAIAFFLALMGGSSGRTRAADAAPPGASKSQAGTLEESAEWKALLVTWKEAEEVASGKRGAYPFDEAGKKKLLDGLDKATQDVDRLVAAGLLAPAEAGLLKKSLAEVKNGVLAESAASGHSTGRSASRSFASPPEASAARLADRLPLLEQLWRDGKFHGAVVRKLMAGIEADLATLSKPENFAGMKPDERKAAERTRDAVKAHIDRLEALFKKAAEPTGVR